MPFISSTAWLCVFRFAVVILALGHILPARAVLAQSAGSSGQTVVLAIAAGDGFSLALTGDHKIVPWGTMKQTDIPVGLENVKAIAASGSAALAITDDNKVVAWGTMKQTDIPVDLENVKAIATAGGHGLALTYEGKVVPLGSGSFGETQVPFGLNDVDAIAAGDGLSLALTGDGKVVAWGYKDLVEKVEEANLSDVKAIAAGYWYGLAIKLDGKVEAWGEKFWVESRKPGFADNRAIAAGRDFSLVLTKDLKVEAWGISDEVIHKTKHKAGLEGVIAIAAGRDHSLALLHDGKVLAWGSNRRQQTAVPSELAHVGTITANRTPSLDASELRDVTASLVAIQGLARDELMADRLTAVIADVQVHCYEACWDPGAQLVGRLNVYGDELPKVTYTAEITAAVTEFAHRDADRLALPPFEHGTDGANLVFEPVTIPVASEVHIELAVADAADPQTVLVQASRSYKIMQQPLAVPRLYFVGVDLARSGEAPSFPPFDLIAHPAGDAFAAAVMPVATSNWSYHAANDQVVQIDGQDKIDPISLASRREACIGKREKGGHTEFVMLWELHDGDPSLSDLEDDYILCRLANIRNRIVIDGVGATELSFIHGWIHDPDDQAIVKLNGAATATASRTGYGTTMSSIGQIIYVHELLHNIARFEAGDSGHGHWNALPITGVYGWDVSKGLLNTWNGAANVAGQLKQGYYPIMAHGQTANSWISPDEFDHFLDYFSNPDLVAISQAGQSKPNLCASKFTTEEIGRPCLSRGNLILSGILRTPRPGSANAPVVLRFPIVELSWLSQPTHTYTTFAGEGAWTLQFMVTKYVTSGGDSGFVETLAAELPFAPTITRLGANGAESGAPAYFEVNVPYTYLTGVVSVKLYNATTGQSFEFLSRDDLNNVTELTPLTARGVGP